VSQWKGISPGEKYQSSLAKGQVQAPINGEPKESRVSGVTSGTISQEGNDSPSMRSRMSKVASGTATTGHDDDTSENPLFNSKSTETEPSSSRPQEHLQQDHGDTGERARQSSPNSTPGDLYSSREAAPETKKLTSEGRRQRGGFLNKLRGWSKRLSHDRKGHN
jgi:hypothetical protein